MLKSKNTALTINDIPQKEDLIMISLVPKLYNDGLKTPRQVADYFGQHVRHGYFLFHECRILGWMDEDGLTEEGGRIARCLREEERNELIKKAIDSTSVVEHLVKKCGKNIRRHPDRERIEEYLFFNVGLASSTAKRRSSAIVAWLEFLSDSSEQRSSNTINHYWDHRK